MIKSEDALKHVEEWLQDKLLNWESYESLEWSDVVQVDVPPYKYVVYHKFNHKNDKGYLNRHCITFYLDNLGRVVNFSDWRNR
ncbi:hypothetical protein QQ008_05260 [Fulvivirgaceae bacterium BMA10]|uniref:Uncharacterized protein n=1 Tax=Splendidivirga corallicola TaxID=3051826 RepID=A0ABT8KKK0_9BACT|nr:hypothetical protein [Fulvivirgaceae bacterium BMA10]